MPLSDGLSCIIISSGGERFLISAVSSCFEDKCIFQELIVVCTESDYSLAKYCKDRFAPLLNHGQTMKVILSYSQWPGSLRNVGMEAATFPYLTFLDSDDLFFIENIKRVVERYSSSCFDVLIYDYLRFEGSELSLGIGSKLDGAKEADKTLVSKLIALPPYCWNKLYRRNWLKEKYIRFEDNIYEDVLWNFRCLVESGLIIVDRDPCVIYRKHDGSLTSSQNIDHFVVFDVYRNTLNYALEKGVGEEVLISLYRVMRSHALHIFLSDRVSEDIKKKWLLRLMENKRYFSNRARVRHFGLLDLGVYFSSPLLVSYIDKFRRLLVNLRLWR